MLQQRQRSKEVVRVVSLGLEEVGRKGCAAESWAWDSLGQEQSRAGGERMLAGKGKGDSVTLFSPRLHHINFHKRALYMPSQLRFATHSG